MCSIEYAPVAKPHLDRTPESGRQRRPRDTALANSAGKYYDFDCSHVEHGFICEAPVERAASRCDPCPEGMSANARDTECTSCRDAASFSLQKEANEAHTSSAPSFS